MKQESDSIHDEAIVIDTHSDTLLRMADPEWDFMETHDDGHMDYPRAVAGGLNAVFLAVFFGNQTGKDAGTAAKKALITIDHVHRLAEKNPDRIALARSARDIRRASAEGRLAVLIGIEGGHIIDNSLELLRTYHRLGARYMTLTHSFHHDWADSAGIYDELPVGNGGLTEFGREVIREMNRIGMMVDISHVSDDTFWDAYEVSSAPIVATHSGARAVCDHRRNLSDEMIKAIAEKSGVVQVVFFPGFLDPGYRENTSASGKAGGGNDAYGMPVSILIDHIEHITDLVGVKYVGLGGDWDGVSQLPVGLEDCSKLRVVTEALVARGYSRPEIKKILGGNILRVMESVEKLRG